MGYPASEKNRSRTWATASGLAPWRAASSRWSRPSSFRPSSLQATLTDVARGVHVLRAEVRDRTGTVVITSDPRTFVVQQTSIQNPNNPANAPGPR